MHKGVAIVTGGTRGIGLGVARALAREGWSLALCGLRSRERCCGRDARNLRLRSRGDVLAGRRRQCERPRPLHASAVAHFGTLHALVNNAGRAPRVRADLLAATEEILKKCSVRTCRVRTF